MLLSRACGWPLDEQRRQQPVATAVYGLQRPGTPYRIDEIPIPLPFLADLQPKRRRPGSFALGHALRRSPEHGRQASQTVSIGIPLRGNFPDSGESDAIPLLGSQLPDLQACILEVGAGVGDVVALIWLGQPDQIMLTGPFFQALDPLLPV